MYKPHINFHLRRVVPASAIVIDCSIPCEDNLFNIQELGAFVVEKLNGTRKNKILKNQYTFAVNENTITFDSNIGMGKRPIKNYIKKFLFANQLKEYIRLLANAKESFRLSYYQVTENEDEEE